MRLKARPMNKKLQVKLAGYGHSRISEILPGLFV